MDKHSIAKKALSTLGMLAVGDSVAFGLAPRRHLHVWSFVSAPRWYRRFERAATRSRASSLAFALAGLGIGIGLVLLAQRRA